MSVSNKRQAVTLHGWPVLLSRAAACEQNHRFPHPNLIFNLKPLKLGCSGSGFTCTVKEEHYEMLYLDSLLVNPAWC